jgi:hypothetical protein
VKTSWRLGSVPIKLSSGEFLADKNGAMHAKRGDGAGRTS